MLTRGFTLIEVLAALAILMFGLLGIAGMMAKGQKTSFEAYQRQQALAVANDMAERIRGNPTKAIDYADAAPVTTPVGFEGDHYQHIIDTSIKNCDSGDTCSTDDLLAFDVAMWEGLLQGYGERTSDADPKLVGSIIGARGCITQLAETSATCSVPGATFTRTLRISVAWQGQEATSVPTLSTCGQGDFGDDDARRRLVALDVMVQNVCP